MGFSKALLAQGGDNAEQLTVNSLSLLAQLRKSAPWLKSLQNISWVTLLNQTEWREVNWSNLLSFILQMSEWDR